MKLVTEYFVRIKSNFLNENKTGAAYFEKVCKNLKELLHLFAVNHIPREVITSLLNQDFKKIYGEESTNKNKTLLAENHIVHLMVEILKKKWVESQLELSESHQTTFHEILHEVLREQNERMNEAGLSPSEVDSGNFSVHNIVLNNSLIAPQLVMPTGDMGYSLVLADAALEWFVSKRVLETKASIINVALQ